VTDRITDPILLARAKHMRANPTPAERALWLALRAKRFEGIKFSRQVVIGGHIVDIAAREHKLAIEIDGETHRDPLADARRTERLGREGYRVIRFTNAEVLGNIEGVAVVIKETLRTAPLPNPLPAGGREL